MTLRVGRGTWPRKRSVAAVLVVTGFFGAVLLPGAIRQAGAGVDEEASRTTPAFMAPRPLSGPRGSARTEHHVNGVNAHGSVNAFCELSGMNATVSRRPSRLTPIGLVRLRTPLLAFETVRADGAGWQRATDDGRRGRASRGSPGAWRRQAHRPPAARADLRFSPSTGLFDAGAMLRIWRSGWPAGARSHHLVAVEHHVVAATVDRPQVGAAQAVIVPGLSSRPFEQEGKE